MNGYATTSSSGQMGVRLQSVSSVRSQPTCSSGSWNGSQTRRGRPNGAEKQPRWRPYPDQPVQIRDQGLPEVIPQESTPNSGVGKPNTPAAHRCRKRRRREAVGRLMLLHHVPRSSEAARPCRTILHRVLGSILRGFRQLTVWKQQFPWWKGTSHRHQQIETAAQGST